MISHSAITDLNALFAKFKNGPRKTTAYIFKFAWTSRMNFTAPGIDFESNEIVCFLQVIDFLLNRLPAFVVKMWNAQILTSSSDTCHLVRHCIISVAHSIPLKLQGERLASNRSDRNVVFNFINHCKTKFMTSIETR